MKRILLFGTVSLALVLLTIVVPPVIFRKTGRHFITEPLSNIRQIGLLLFDFEQEYGRFPDASTIPAVQAATGTTLDLGDSSSKISYAN